ncbi:hypothetical protein ACWGCW_13865 [Streptomyces sp. NPDC054933]
MRTAKIAGVAALAAITLLPSGTAHAVSNPPGGGGHYLGSSISRGDTMYPGDYIDRVNDYQHEVMLVMQSDGNLVEYVSTDPTSDPNPWKPCWASNTYGSGADHASYQQDGNFVVYTPNNTPKWASNTQWGAGSTVDINGNGVVFVGQTPITGTCIR